MLATLDERILALTEPKSAERRLVDGLAEFLHQHGVIETIV